MRTLEIGSQGVRRMVPRLTLPQVAPGLACLLDYKSQWWSADLRAGLSVAAVALPVAIAYAADQIGIKPDGLGDAIDNHKIITEAVHFGETQIHAGICHF